MSNVVEYEMTEDEIMTIRMQMEDRNRVESAVPLQASLKHEEVVESNPYMWLRKDFPKIREQSKNTFFLMKTKWSCDKEK